MLLHILATFSLASVSYAQMTHNVTVGANGVLAFEPNQITASMGDTVNFLFMPKNHSATQSSFDSPCSKLLDNSGNANGFDSGFQPVPPGGDIRIVSFTVQTESPLWFYCRQTGHCAQGMVFAINAPTTGNHTFDKFLANALGSGVNNNTTTTTSPPPSTATSSMLTVTTPPPSESVVTVTQTVTLGGTTWTTTYGSYPGSPNPTPNDPPVVHNVDVGENGTLTFNPSNITAQPRDIILFKFVAKNHTATQSSFANPCRPLGDTTPNRGFDSGFEPVTPGDLIPQLFNITVNDTAPIWVYCRQTNPSSHCGAGMVFSVNAVEGGSNSFEAFKANAIRLNGTASNSTSPSKPQSGAASLASVPSFTLTGVGIGLVSVLWMLTL